MRVILFQPRFAALVESGRKLQTIRKRAHCRPGDVLSLRTWSDKPYRSKQRILRQAICTSVESIFIGDEHLLHTFIVGGRRLDMTGWAALARADGFGWASEMLDWFSVHHGLPFQGDLIKWTEIAPPSGASEPWK